MIVIRAFVGQTAYFLGFDEHSEPFMLPHIQTAWNFDTWKQAELAMEESKKLPHLAHYDMEIFGSEEPVSCSG